MCGIAGLITNPLTSESELIRNAHIMGEALTHRGPDDSGVWADSSNGIALAHKRLSIIDLSKAGHQPMKSPTGRFIISFNGEIYNHREIRKKLENESNLTKSWKGLSDTETFIAAIEAWGLINTLNLSAGMFAFALWDRKEKKLSLVRDRFGEKPLYWGKLRTDNFKSPIIAFGSELSAIRSLPSKNLEINKSSLYSYFQYGYISAPESIQKDIFQVPPGKYITIDTRNEFYYNLNSSSYKSWWDSEERSLMLKCNDKKFSYKEKLNYIDGLENILELAVKQQSQSDVPLGTFLSGGIDSSLVAALFQKQSKSNINTFTISFPDQFNGNDSFNEGPYAESVANHLGTDHKDIALTAKDAMNIIPNICSYYSEPFADSSQVPTYLVCSEARKTGLKVAITGDGGDEVFGGYNRHILAPQINDLFGNLPKKLKLFVTTLINLSKYSNLNISNEKRQKLIKAILVSNSLDEIYLSLTSFFENKSDFPLLDLDIYLKKSIYSLPTSINKSEKIMLADILTYLPFDILVKVDRASMAVGLETRAPFLDYRVAEYAWGMPLEVKIANNGFKKKSKFALRHILNKYVPNKLIDRPKAGFSMPIGNWLKGPLRPWAEDLLSEELIEAQGYLKKEHVYKLWNEHLSGERDNTSKLWTILMWQSWFSKWS